MASGDSDFLRDGLHNPVPIDAALYFFADCCEPVERESGDPCSFWEGDQGRDRKVAATADGLRLEGDEDTFAERRSLGGGCDRLPRLYG